MNTILFIFLSFLVFAYAEYEECAQGEIVTGVKVWIARDTKNSKAQITIVGPYNAWFGYGFGSLKMNNTYAVIASGALSGNTFTVQERILGNSGATDQSQPGVPVSSSGNILTALQDTTTRRVVIEVPYSNVNGLYEFLECMSMDYEYDLIAAFGTDQIYHNLMTGNPLDYNYHGPTNRAFGSVMNFCCMMGTTTNFFMMTEEPTTGSPTTGEPSKAPTPKPDDNKSGIEQIGYILNIICVLIMGFVMH